MNNRRKIVIILFLLFFPLNVFASAPVDVTKMSIPELREALDLGIITSERLVKIYLDRIEEYDSSYKSIISINENALSLARSLDEEDVNRSPLHGIPIVVKDNIDVYGMPTTAGAKALSDNMPNENSPAIQKLINAGAIIIAKANMSEFAFSARTSNSSYGVVKNAYNVNYSPYGSSGGTATAVALSFAAAGLGTDTNSSVRLPAAANNLIGFRPTTGLISRSGTIPYDPQRDTIGIIAKDTTSVMLILSVINGYDSADNKSVNQNTKTYNQIITNLNNITIGIPKDFMYGDNSNSISSNKRTYSEIIDLMERAAQNLESKGAKVVYLDSYYNYQTSNWFESSLSGHLFCDGFNDYIKNTTGTIRSFQALSSSSGLTTNLSSYISSCNASGNLTRINNTKDLYREYIDNIIDDNNLDLIAYPSSKNKLSPLNDVSTLNNLSAHASSTLDYPAISLPLGFDQDGLPYGVEFLSKANTEEMLLSVASVYEENYYKFISPASAISLYEVPSYVEDFTKSYIEISHKDKLTKKEERWIDKAKEIFLNYSDNIDEILNLNIELQEISEGTTLKDYKIVFSFLVAIILIMLSFRRKRKLNL